MSRQNQIRVGKRRIARNVRLTSYGAERTTVPMGRERSPVAAGARYLAAAAWAAAAGAGIRQPSVEPSCTVGGPKNPMR